jgi:hypothetical protein
MSESILNTVKPAHVVTSIKQSPVLIEPLLSGHLYYKVTFSCPVIEHFI